MRNSILRDSVFGLAGLVVVASAANAAIVSANLPTVNENNQAIGAFSDAYSSNGNYYYGESLASRFTTGQTWNLSQLTFWGFSENYQSSGLANVAGFQLQILSSDFSSVLVNKTWTLGELAVQATGNIGVTGGIEYQLAGGLNNVLGPGTYWLNIGVVMNDPDGDAWVWTSGMNSSGLAGVASSNGDGGWNPWQVQETSWAGSHILFGQLVPAPGALALLATAGLAAGRRRRA